MNEEAYRPNIPGVANWRRPPWACPGCLELLPIEYQPREGLEAYGVRCPHCGTSIRFVREEVRGAIEGRPGATIWVPALSTDRFSRTAKRKLMEPNLMDWSPSSVPGFPAGTADPSGSFCDYPERGESVRVERRWSKKLSNDALVSVSAVHGELWVLSCEGDLHVLRPVDGTDLVCDSPEDPVPAGGSPLRLKMKTVHPPAHSGGIWFITGNDSEAVAVERSVRTPDNLAHWPQRRCQLPRSWRWVEAGPAFAVVGCEHPTFVSLAQNEQGEIHLAVFEISPSVVGTQGVMLPSATVELPRCSGFPVQLPITAASQYDTEAVLGSQEAWMLGALVWPDAYGSLHCIATRERPPSEWQSIEIVDNSGPIIDPLRGQGPGGRMVQGAAAPQTSHFPPLPRSAASVDEEALDSVPPVPPPPGMRRTPPPPPLPTPPPPPPGVSVPAPPRGVGNVPPVPRDPPGRPATPPSMPPPPPPALPSGDAKRRAVLRTAWQDRLMITKSRFAGSAHTVLPGVRVWQIVRPRLGGSPSVRHIAVLGETGASRHQGWSTVQDSVCSAAEGQQEGVNTPIWIASAPVFCHLNTGTTDIQKRLEPFIAPVVVASSSMHSVFDASNLMNERDVQRSNIDDMPLACSPIVAPYGILVFFNRRLEVWTLEKNGTSRAATYPSEKDHVEDSQPGAERSLVLQTGSEYPISPAVIGNNIWIPSESGVVYCLSVRPSSECP